MRASLSFFIFAETSARSFFLAPWSFSCISFLNESLDLPLEGAFFFAGVFFAAVFFGAVSFFFFEAAAFFVVFFAVFFFFSAIFLSFLG